MRDALPEPLAARFRRVPLLRRLFETKEGDIVVGQFPNAPIIAAVLLTGVGFLLTGTLGVLLGVAGRVAFAVWAVMELGWGVNPFRRILGGLVLLGTLASFALRHS